MMILTGAEGGNVDSFPSWETNLSFAVNLQKAVNDKYENLIIVHADIHRLIHATELETINKYVKLIKDDKQLKKLNNLSRLVGLENIEITL